MPSKAQIEKAVQEHFDAWNTKDRRRWLANFSSEIVMEDPYGGPHKTGRSALESTWEESFKEGREWQLDRTLTQICHDQAAVVDHISGIYDGQPFTLDSIEIFTVDDAGKVCHIRSYFNPPEGEQLDPYFMEVDPDS